MGEEGESCSVLLLPKSGKALIVEIRLYRTFVIMQILCNLHHLVVRFEELVDFDKNVRYVLEGRVLCSSAVSDLAARERKRGFSSGIRSTPCARTMGSIHSSEAHDD